MANCKQYFVLPDLNFEYFSHVTLGFGTIFTRNLVILHTFHTVLGDLCILLTVLYLGIVHTFNILINVKIAILQGRFRCLRSQRLRGHAIFKKSNLIFVTFTLFFYFSKVKYFTVCQYSR